MNHWSSSQDEWPLRIGLTGPSAPSREPVASMKTPAGSRGANRARTYALFFPFIDSESEVGECDGREVRAESREIVMLARRKHRAVALPLRGE